MKATLSDLPSKLLVSALLLAFTLPGFAADPWMPKDCRVDMKGDEIQLSFPAIYEAADWTWFQTDTSDDSLEYSFEVLLKSGENTRGIGFYLFKLGGMQPASGAEQDFFAQGRVMAWTKVANGRRLVPVSGIGIQQRDKRIVIDIHDKQTQKALFASGPRAALFSTLHPDPKLTYGCVASVPSNAHQAAMKLR